MTGAANGTKKSTTSQNAVHGDAIWRQIIKNELNGSSAWENNWGFMRDLYKDMAKSEVDAVSSLKLPPITNFRKNSSSTPSTSQFPISEKFSLSKKDSEYDNFAMSYQIKRLIGRAGPNEKYTFPATTAEVYGWDWNKHTTGQPQKLEPFGRLLLGRGKGDVMKWWFC
ncbi:hypothetical protein BKA69DRAFT_1124140 [Paraphysoderma sedebokerense]|nr:hypothetical protein BKA69DRAFT_1124140 [Paraphysoderma sedebokerense]